MSNRFMLNETSYHGHGAVENVVPEIVSRGFKKILVCTDADLLKFGVASKVTDLLDKAGISYQVYSDIKANPIIENVKNGVEVCKSIGADGIVAIGGGSVMDTAKAIGIIINNPTFADVRSLEGVAPTTKPCLPIIAVATTAGTAAEVTINYVDNIPPEITLRNINISYKVKSNIIDLIKEHEKITDNVDTEVDIVIIKDEYTGNETKVGTYFLSFKAVDDSKNETYAMINVNVIDEELPIIFVDPYVLYTSTNARIKLLDLLICLLPT